MGIETGVAVSTKDDLVDAAVEAAQEARAHSREPKLVLMFVNHSYSLDRLSDATREVKKLFPTTTRLAGGTVNGITYGDVRHDAMFNNKRAVAIVVFGGDLDVGVAIVSDPTKDPFEAGKTLALEARTSLGSIGKGGIILTPGMSGFHVVDQLILDGVRNVNPRLRMTGTGLTAGLTPDGQIVPGFAFLDDRIEQRGTVLINFAGPTSLGFSSANGMEAVGSGGFVTEAEGAVIKTIDRRPARDAILDLLCGDDSVAREQFTKNAFIAAVERGVTLGAVDPEGGHYWCHMPVAFLPDGSAIDPFNARRGTPLSVVRIDSNTCMAAVKDAGGMLVEDAGTSEFELTLAFSCALRGYTLGAEVAHEDMQLRGQVKSKQHLGIVANGEVSCYRHGRAFATGWVYALFGMAEQGR